MKAILLSFAFIYLRGYRAEVAERDRRTRRAFARRITALGRNLLWLGQPRRRRNINPRQFRHLRFQLGERLDVILVEVVLGDENGLGLDDVARILTGDQKRQRAK